MAELFRALQRTPDIDRALLEVYEMDQFGLDSAWRESLGLEALPSPEELEKQLEASSSETDKEPVADEPPVGDSDETVSGAETAGESAPEPTADSKSQPAARVFAEGEGEENDADPVSPGGCSAPVHDGTGSIAASIGMLALLASPAGLVILPALRRRWPFS